MSGSVFQSIGESLRGVIEVLLSLGLPMAILVGAAVVGYALKGSVFGREGKDVIRFLGRTAAYLIVGLVVACGWSGLKELRWIAQDKVYLSESELSSEEPVLKAPPIDQYGPVSAAMVEKTYKRTLTLPPEFFQRIGAEGVGILSPYLVDPTAENVLSMVDSFRRSGQDVVFSRELTRTDEDPVPFDTADIKVRFERLHGRSYRVEYDATYSFTNETDAPIEGRFLFTPPQNGGTVQALKVQVGDHAVDEPDDRGNFAWIGTVDPGEQKSATVSYESVGTGSWDYHLGSSRRRVRDFRLTASIDGPVKFESGTISPTKREEGVVEWQLDDVLTSQRLGLTFPEDVAVRDAYLQSLSLLPAGMVLMLLAVVAIGLRTGRFASPKRLALVAVLVVIGLGSSFVLSDYFGYIPAVVIGSLVAAAGAASVVGWRSLAVLLPIALVPATSMSQRDSGLWLMILIIVAIGIFVSPFFASESLRSKQGSR